MERTVHTKAVGLDPFVFIVGRGRSGTTLAKAMLTSHPDLAIPPETHFIVPLSRDPRIVSGGRLDVDALCSRLFRQPGFVGLGLSSDEVQSALNDGSPSTFPEAIRILFTMYAAKDGKSRYGDKTPIHVLHIGVLAEMFPEARFIHIIRDGRDVSLSYLDVEFGAQSLWEGAIYWRRFVAEGRRAGRSIGPGRYMEMRYEDLTADPLGQVRKLCAFVRLDFDPSMLRYFEKAERVGASQAHHPNLHLPPTRGLRDWRKQMTLKESSIFEVLAGDLLSELGYERAVPNPSGSARALARYEYARVGVRRLSHRVSVKTRRLHRRLPA